MTDQAPKALIFDFDGVILDTESAIVESYGEVYKAHGAPFDRDRLLRAAGTEFEFDPWLGVRARLDRPTLAEQHRACCEARILQLPILPGIVTLLDAAVATGLRIGLASNSHGPYVESHLSRLGLRHYFQFLSCRETVVLPKPAPALYANVLRHFGITGTEAVAIEDSQTGTLAAKRAGLWVVAVPNLCTAAHDFAAADVILPTLADETLAGLIKRLRISRSAIHLTEAVSR